MKEKMTRSSLQYISDETGEVKAVIVPIEVWREIESEKETAYLLDNEVMKKRLVEAKNRDEGIPLEVVREQLGI